MATMVGIDAETVTAQVEALLETLGQVGVQTSNSSYMLHKVGSRYIVQKLSDTPGYIRPGEEYTAETWSFVQRGSGIALLLGDGESHGLLTSELMALVVPFKDIK